MYKAPPQTSHAPPSSHRTLTESLPPIQAKVVARIAGAQTREPRAAGGRGKAVRVDEMASAIQDRLRAALRDRNPTVALTGDRDAPAALSGDPAKVDQARDATLARFTARELAVAYASRGEAHTLRELIHMLFDASSDASRAQAAAFLAPVVD
jgi:hypothetical protein